MKSLFTVGAKLIGLWLIYNALLSLLQSLPYFERGDNGLLDPLYLSFVLSFLVSLIVGFVMVLKTDWLSRIVGLKDEDSTAHSVPDERTILSVGIRLVGLLVLVLRFPGFYEYFQLAFSFTSRPDGFGYDYTRFVISFFLYLLPLYLVFGWRRITDLLDRPASVPEKS